MELLRLASRRDPSSILAKSGLTVKEMAARKGRHWHLSTPRGSGTLEVTWNGETVTVEMRANRWAPWGVPASEVLGAAIAKINCEDEDAEYPAADDVHRP